MNSSVKITRDNTEMLRKLLSEVGRTEVLVGVPSDAEQPHLGIGTIGSATRIEGDINNAELAAIHDRGAPEANIPARPFMLPGIEKVENSIEAHLKTATVGLLAGDETLFENELHLVGNIAVDSIRKTIEDGIPPPLAASTIAARRRRGNPSSTPLIDTKQLLHSISYVIRKT